MYTLRYLKKSLYLIGLCCISVFCSRNDRSSDKMPFDIIPGDIPNYGFLYVDHQRAGRSGHVGNTIAECKNHDIISFYSNVSLDSWEGHGVGVFHANVGI